MPWAPFITSWAEVVGAAATEVPLFLVLQAALMRRGRG